MRIKVKGNRVTTAEKGIARFKGVAKKQEKACPGIVTITGAAKSRRGAANSLPVTITRLRHGKDRVTKPIKSRAQAA